MREGLSLLLSPRSLALVGVSSRPDSLSCKLLANLQRSGFGGAIYPVNPKAQTIGGLRCYPQVKALPATPDLAVLLVPRDLVLPAAEECLEAGVKALVVITAGFREGGEEGRRLEQALVQRVRQAGACLLGPNCMGLINTQVALDATFSPVPPLPGGVAFASHSGALGVAMLEAAAEVGLGFSTFVSLGNSADLNVCDFLEAFGEDPATRAVMLYLEAVEEPRRFLAVARSVSREKPIVALKAGRTATGSRAASSHTGALAAGDNGVEALFRQAGVIRAETLAELLDWARTFERVAAPQGPRVAVVSNAGGPAIAACDALERAQLQLASFSDTTQQTLASFLPPEAAVGTPVDMLPSATPENYARAVEVVAQDPQVDAVVVIVVTPPVCPVEEVAQALDRTASQLSKPNVAVFMTSPAAYPTLSRFPHLGPVFRFPEAAVAALAKRWVTTRLAARPLPEPLVPLLVKAPPGKGFLGPKETANLLSACGIPVAPQRVVRRLEQLGEAAGDLGYPLVLKAFGQSLVHKTEVGAVALGVESPEELLRQARTMTARLESQGHEVEGFLLQPYLRGGRELIAGVSRDPVFGPLVMCGLGGVAVEVWRDVSFRLAPIDRAEAGAMLQELRGKALLGAFRGQPAADLETVQEVLVKLSQLAVSLPELAECDLNPLLVFPQGQGCVAVDARVRLDG